jgi:hypothetical protein
MKNQNNDSSMKHKQPSVSSNKKSDTQNNEREELRELYIDCVGEVCASASTDDRGQDWFEENTFKRLYSWIQSYTQKKVEEMVGEIEPIITRLKYQQLNEGKADWEEAYKQLHLLKEK